MQVRYKGAASRPDGFYLLAVAFRKGIFFFQAITPQPLLRDSDSHLNTLRAFSDAVLVRYPLANPGSAQDMTRMEAVIETAAGEMGAGIGRLAD